MTNLNARKSAIISSLLTMTMIFLSLPAAATYSLVWSDEFDGTSLNYSNWTTDIGNGCPDLCGWGNNELQYYRAQNVTVADGYLTLTSREEHYGGNSFTSGKVHTRNKHSFLYGRFEMRAKLPTGGGTWPAFWMMPQDDVYGGWAASGEIDIMESANGTTSIGGALHYGGSYPENTSTSSSYSQGGSSFADDFHIYAVEWEPDVIRWYVDGNLFSTRYSNQWYSSAAPGNPRAPFDQEFYLILNSAVGGWYTGCTSPGCITADLPQEYIIDYVRVYEDIDNFAPTMAITAPVNGSTLPAGDINIEVTASDEDGTVTKVEFYNGPTLLGEDTSAPFSFLWSSVPDGCYTLSARAIDDLGGSTSDSVEITVGEGCGQASFTGAPQVFPTRIEAEDFDLGGQAIAYHDSDPVNSGGAYRPDEGVDIEATNDAGGGFNVGWINGGEWMEYTVEVPATGSYTIETRFSSLFGNKRFHVEFNGEDKTGSVILPSTTNWQTWATVSTTVELTAGQQTMRFVAETDGFNLNYFDVMIASISDVPENPTATHVLHPCYPNPFNPSTTISFELQSAAEVALEIFDVKGRAVRTLVAGDLLGQGPHRVTWDGKDSSGHIAAAGVYFYRLKAGDFGETRRMTLVK